MAHEYDLLIFDWEGTLADTMGHIINIISTESSALGYDKVSPENARLYVELGLVRALHKLFPKLNDRQHEELLYNVQKGMSKKSTEVFLLPGAKSFLEQLSAEGYDLAIATNKSHSSLERALNSSQLSQLFHVTRSAGQAAPKPDPQMVNEIMDILNVLPEKTLMIGDSPSDMEMATNAGIHGLGFDFYQQLETSLIEAGAKSVCKNYKQVAEFLDL